MFGCESKPDLFDQWLIFIYNAVPEPYDPKFLVYCTLYELQCIFSSFM